MDIKKLSNDYWEKIKKLPLDNIWVISGKELNNLFNSLIAYVVMVVFLLVWGYFYAAPLFVINRASMRHIIQMAPMLYLFFVPAMTMRIFSEEMKSGTIEILFTQPIKDYEILLGKYLASVLFLGIIICVSLIYPLLLFVVGSPDIGQIFTSYVGLVLLGSTYAAIGVFASTLTKNQIVSFIVSFVICFVLFILSQLTALMPPALAAITDYLGIDRHFGNITRGVIDTRDLVYYFSLIVFFLYLTFGIIRNRR